MTPIWTAPRSWTTGEIVTASVMNEHVRDNFEFIKQALETPFSHSASSTGSGFSTTSTSFVDIHSSFTDTITTTGAPILIGVCGTWKCTVSGGDCCIDISIDGTRIGDATYGVQMMQPPAANAALPFHWTQLRTIGAGTHTIKPVWRTSTGTLSLLLLTSFFAIELI